MKGGAHRAEADRRARLRLSASPPPTDTPAVPLRCCCRTGISAARLWALRKRHSTGIGLDQKTKQKSLSHVTETRASGSAGPSCSSDVTGTQFLHLSAPLSWGSSSLAPLVSAHLTTLMLASLLFIPQVPGRYLTGQVGPCVCPGPVTGDLGGQV